VRDNGTGIRPDILARVFEPFFTTKPPGAGSGLGLSQVFGTARQLGGEVRIESEVGKGTAVTVDLPRAAIPTARLGTGRPEPRLIGASATILLVDDDDPVRAITATMLRELGYNVRDVNGGEAALAVLSQDSGIDILLTDLVMPEMSGSRLASTARSRYPDLPVVFISGYADQIGDALDPSYRLIRKPFTSVDLYRAIELELAEARASQRAAATGVAV
jgi:CheY-like chemotaxis protein